MCCKTALIFAAMIVSGFRTAVSGLPIQRTALEVEAVSGSGQPGSGIALFSKGYLRIDMFDAARQWVSANVIAIGTCTLFGYTGLIPTYVSYPKLTVYPDGQIVVNRQLFDQANCSKRYISSTAYKLPGSVTYTKSYGAYTLSTSHVLSYSRAAAFIPSTICGAIIKKYYSSSCNESIPVGMHLTSLGCHSYGVAFGNASCSSSLGFTFTPYSYNAGNATCVNSTATATQFIQPQCTTYSPLAAYSAVEPNNIFNYQTVECVGV